jgi:hypothetical protein
MRQHSYLKIALSVWFAVLLSSCALMSSWHWEKAGASEAEYSFDETQCKAKTYAGNDGTVTNATVRRMLACMEARGWRKVPN